MEEVPEVENFVRVQAGWKEWNLHLGEKRFLEEYLAGVDQTFFEIFQFPFIKGDPKTALIDRYSIVLTEDLAQKIFGDEDSIGKIVQLNNTDMTVTGIINNVPRNSHLHFTYAFPAVNMTKWRESKLDAWSYDQFATYVILRKGSDIAEVNKKMMAIINKHLPNLKGKGRVYLQPLKDIHLHSTGINTWMLAYPNKGNITYVHIFSLTAFCILLLACINFMNLTTARYGTRAKEVGMRKVVGARRSDLIKQFLGEWGTTQVDWQGRDPSVEVKIARGSCSYDYLKVFNLKIVEGRFFSPKFAKDDQNWVLNETAVKAMGMEDPIGKWFSFRGQKGMIIGILKDFHGSSLHNPIAPVAMQPGQGFHMFARYRPGNVAETLAFLKTKWEKFVGKHIPFRFDFIDEEIENWYRTDQQGGKIFLYFTVLTVFIACLGLFGLASFMTERRTKEIGIRKVLGAKVSGIVLLLTKEFAKWVVVANVIAWPSAYFVSKRWLQGFAYRIELGWEIFVFSAVAALVIAVGTVSYRAIKTATANPVKALRYE